MYCKTCHTGQARADLAVSREFIDGKTCQGTTARNYVADLRFILKHARHNKTWAKRQIAGYYREEVRHDMGGMKDVPLGTRRLDRLTPEEKQLVERIAAATKYKPSWTPKTDVCPKSGCGATIKRLSEFQDDKLVPASPPMWQCDNGHMFGFDPRQGGMVERISDDEQEAV